MSGISTYLENKLIDLILRGQTYTAPADIYIALYTCTNGVIARSTTYAVGNTAVVLASDNTYHLYTCTAETGATAATAPAFHGVANEVITDGGVTWTEQDSVLEGGGGTEVTGGGYTRYTTTGALTSWSGTQGLTSTTASSGTSGLSANNASISFPQSTAAWAAAPAMVWGVGLYDASTAGNLLGWGPLATPQNVGSGVTITFGVSQLTFSLV